MQGIELLADNDTPGYGLELTNPEFRTAFKGVETDRFTITKNSAKNDNDIDVYSGATVINRSGCQGCQCGNRFPA